MSEFVTSTDDQGNTWHVNRGLVDFFRRPRTRYRLIWREEEWFIVSFADDGTLNLQFIERLAVWVAYKGMVHPANYFPDGKGGFQEEPLYLGCVMDDCSWPKCHLRRVALPPCPILKGLI